MKPIAYEGTEPYIFVSYAHRDAEIVYGVLNELQARGYRFWYDDGIAPGSEWPEDIARHLDAAQVVIAFITQNSMASQNCRREINFSLSREKPFLSILMEKTEMPLGMQMQLSAQQSIVRYNYDSWEGFVAKVLSCPDIAPCKVPERTAEVMAPQAAPVELAPIQSAGAPEPVVAPKPTAGEPASEPTAQTKRRKGKKDKPMAGNRGKKPLLIVGALLMVAIMLRAVLGIVGSMGNYTTSWDATIKKDATSVSATTRALTQEDLEAIAKLEGLSTLSLTNCDLSACSFANLSFASDKIRTMSLTGSTGVDSYGFLSGLALSNLNLSGCQGFSDADLASLNLEGVTSLHLDGTGVTDLAPLAAAPKLQELDFSDTAVATIAPLEGLAELRKVAGSGTQVTTLSPLRDLEKLTDLDFAGCPLTELCESGAFAALSLKSVFLGDTDVSDLGALANCTRLESLSLYATKVSDLSWLDAQNYATLKLLSLSRTGVPGESLGWIGQCAQLETLALSGIALPDLSFCDTLPNLTFLRAENCGLTDIGPLANCTALKKVILNHNAIEDVSPLSHLASIDTNTVLDLSFNELSSVADLADGKYRALLLYGNTSAIAATIPNGVSAYEVVTPWFETVTTSALTSRRNDFSAIYLVGCPQNQVLDVEDALGSGRVKLVSEDELWQIYAEDSFAYALNLDMGYFLSLV